MDCNSGLNTERTTAHAVNACPEKYKLFAFEDGIAFYAPSNAAKAKISIVALIGAVGMGVAWAWL
jgi:hypothetical protein